MYVYNTNVKMNKNSANSTFQWRPSRIWSYCEALSQLDRDDNLRKAKRGVLQ